MKKSKIKRKKNTAKISIWKFIDNYPDDDCWSLVNHIKHGTLPNLTGIYFRSKKGAIKWKEKLLKKRKMWDCKLFKIDLYFKKSK